MIEKIKNPLMVTEASLPKYENYVTLIKKLWSTKRLTNQGIYHDKLQSKLRDFLKVNGLTLFCNGHSALDCAIKQLLCFDEEKYTPSTRQEVITTPYTFVSTIHAIAMNGLTPIFCDIKSDDYTIDEDKIERLITKNTVAIICTHVYGFPCNIDKINAIAQKHKLKVIYDAAHAFGVEVNGIPIGNFGDVSMFSFHATKVFNTIEGGALTYKDSHLESKFNLLKNFGISNTEEIVSFGLNAKMNEFQAAMGIENLKSISKNIENRRIATEFYHEKLSKIPGIKLSSLKPNVKYNYSYMPIVIDENLFGLSRDALYDKLTEYNIYPRKYFYPLISNTDIYRCQEAQVDTADYISERILCLPLSGNIKEQDVNYVCNVIKNINRSTQNA